MYLYINYITSTFNLNFVIYMYYLKVYIYFLFVYLYLSMCVCNCMCECFMCYVLACAHLVEDVKGIGQILEVSSVLLVWELGIEFILLGLCGKYFFPVTHLARPAF